jgi:hypothetical protein
LGELLPDGCLVHLGAKIFRSNPVIESKSLKLRWLYDLDSVKELQWWRRGCLCHKRLIAYIVLRSTPAPTTSALRAALKKKLPDYMVPSVFVFLDKMPVIGIGKINRNAPHRATIAGLS